MMIVCKLLYTMFECQYNEVKSVSSNTQDICKGTY